MTEKFKMFDAEFWKFNIFFSCNFRELYLLPMLRVYLDWRKDNTFSHISVGVCFLHFEGYVALYPNSIPDYNIVHNSFAKE